jgi:TPR repeat protein
MEQRRLKVSGVLVMTMLWSGVTIAGVLDCSNIRDRAEKSACEERDIQRTNEKLDEARKYLGSGSLFAARQKFEWLANLGVKEAQYITGGFFDTESDWHGAVREKEKQHADRLAAEWYTKSAELGYPPAQLALAKLYVQGRYFNTDFTKAAYWFEQASSNGESEANLYLGMMLLKGDGVKNDFDRAIELFENASSAGDERAGFLVAAMYKNGIGVEQDYLKAFEWYAKGEDVDHDRDYWGYESKQLLVGDDYRKTSCTVGAIKSMHLGLMFHSGLGVEQDFEKANNAFRKGIARWLGSGASKENDECLAGLAMYHIGVMHLKGEGLKQDYLLSYKWLSYASRLGHDAAAELLEMLSESMSPDYRAVADKLAKADGIIDVYDAYGLPELLNDEMGIKGSVLRFNPPSWPMQQYYGDYEVTESAQSHTKRRSSSNRSRNRSLLSELRGESMLHGRGGISGSRGSSGSSSRSSLGHGDCASAQGDCIGQCGGDGECIAQCAASHGRCVGAVSNPAFNSGQCMGYCASEQGVCIGNCRGNGPCIGQCAAAHGRCVSRCN